MIYDNVQNAVDLNPLCLRRYLTSEWTTPAVAQGIICEQLKMLSLSDCKIDRSYSEVASCSQRDFGFLKRYIQISNYLLPQPSEMMKVFQAGEHCQHVAVLSRRVGRVNWV